MVKLFSCRLFTQSKTAKCIVRTLDFAEFPAGEKVSFDALQEKGYNVDITVVGNGFCSPDGRPMIFNTSAPTCNDGDLGQANMGNALIIQEAAHISSCVPDDCRRGGLVRFDFTNHSDLRRLVIADQDSAVTIWFETDDGGTVNIPKVPRGPNGSVYTHVFDPMARNVATLYVDLAGSGGISELEYEECSETTKPTPAPKTSLRKSSRCLLIICVYCLTLTGYIMPHRMQNANTRLFAIPSGNYGGSRGFSRQRF